MTDYYRTGTEHILDELKRLTLVIQLQVLKTRAKPDEFGGLYISDEEVDALLGLDEPLFPSSNDVQGHTLIDLVVELEREIEEKKRDSLRKGIQLTLPMLANIFGLSPFETDVVLICVAPELDTKYEKLYAYLRNDVTKKTPSVDLILQLLCETAEEKLHARHCFTPDAPLMKHHLIHVVEDSEEEKKSALSRSIKVDDRIISYILGFYQIETDLQPFTALIRAQTNLEKLHLSEDLRERVYHLLARWEGTGEKPTCLLQGPYGAGKKAIAQGICKELEIPLLIVDFGAVIHRGNDLEDALSHALREAQLQDSALYLEHFEHATEGGVDDSAFKERVVKRLSGFPGVTFLASESSVNLGGAVEKVLVTLEIPVPDYGIRKQLWARWLNGKFTEDDLSGLATKFEFTPGQIRDAIESAGKLVGMRGHDDFTLEDLYDGCRAQSNQKLVALAKRIKPHYGWNDLVLPGEKKAQLKEVKNYIKHKGVVYDEWGFDNKLSLGKGLNILFSGPSGTGKTMAAEVIASELNLDLYKIDLSMVVSKYIGETEKNLNKIFKEAERSNAILFFDEADALFGKRSEVRDSHDRYANVEISYLLQKMEENEGIVILATNLSRNIDDAFLRRMHFTIEFPFPEEEYRYNIWKGLFPKEAPRSEDIDFEFLAKRFKIAGGNIKNTIVNAAFLAAEDSSVITMAHIIKATKREFQKMGKVCSPSEFGKYYEMISKE